VNSEEASVDFIRCSLSPTYPPLTTIHSRLSTLHDRHFLHYSLAFLVSIVFVAPLPAQVKLEWLLEEGESFLVERVHTRKQTVAVPSGLWQEERCLTALFAVTFKKKNQAGYVLDLRIDKFSSEPRGEKRSRGAKDERVAIAALMPGSVFTATVTRQGKLIQLDGYAAFIQRLAGNNAEAEKALRALLPEEALRQDIEDVFHFLPDMPVGKGDTWRRETTEPVPPFGSFQSSLEYTYQGAPPPFKAGSDRCGKCIVIGVMVKTGYRPPGNNPELFHILGAKLKAQSGKGSILFDVVRGRLESSEQIIHVAGDLIVAFLGKETRMEFTSESTLRIKVYAKKDDSQRVE
jgi:hypothetical protein